MVIICEECGKVYKLDSEKLKKSVKGNSTKIKCKICDHVINLTLTDNDIFSSENPKFDESVDSNIESEIIPEDTLREKIVISEEPKEQNLDKSTKKIRK